MRLLITAGPTCVPIDSVRVITNLASGKTGLAIASIAVARGYQVTLLTSRMPDASFNLPGCDVRTFSTPDDLGDLLADAIKLEPPDAIIHSAAVSDFTVGKILDSRGHPADSAKLDSANAPFHLELVRAPKVIDKIRKDWGFRGLLVGFKLESGLDTPALIREAEITRQRTGADLMVANHHQTASQEAFIGPGADQGYHRVERSLLPGAVLTMLKNKLA